jgi:catechol 2,3-dioxygenase-like lactoylglutathione lyase family enzyme
LLLNAPGAGGAGSTLPGDRTPEPGGWNRFQLEFDDLEVKVEALRQAGARLRSDIVRGNGRLQILVDDPSGNPIELFEPHNPER